jgi:hypothetical protein
MTPWPYLLAVFAVGVAGRGGAVRRRGGRG